MRGRRERERSISQFYKKKIVEREWHICGGRERQIEEERRERE